jgi:hypothetical protein
VKGLTELSGGSVRYVAVQSLHVQLNPCMCNSLHTPFQFITCVVQGFLAPGTDTTPIVPALEKIWADSMGQSMANFNFRLVTSKFNELVYQYPIRIPERFALVIR